MPTSPTDQPPADAHGVIRASKTPMRPPAVWVLVALGSGFGALSGPFVSAVVNHGHPVHASIFAAPVLVCIALLFLRVISALDRRPRRSVFPEVAAIPAILVAGGVLFMLPHALTLPATGDFWWRTDAERYAVSCAPYPFVSWLVFSRAKHRLIPLAACVAAAVCLVTAWPKLIVGATAQSATALRGELGLPAASLYTVSIPHADPTDGYFADGTTVSVSYNVVDPNKTSARNVGFDLALTVYPAHGTSPCPDLSETLSNVLLSDAVGAPGAETCRTLPNGRWRYTSEFNPDYVTEVERAGGYYMALTVDAQDVTTPFPQLFADTHHPDSAELLAIGLNHDLFDF